MGRRLLIIEDDRELAELARVHLCESGYEVQVEHEGRRGAELATTGDYDLLLLDLMLPGVDGLEICRRVRALDRYVPIVVLTAKGDEFDRVLGLELGADDYVTKPVGLRELVARVRALFRRIDALERDAAEAPVVIERGPLRVEPAARKASLYAEPLELTAKEFDLLAHFAAHPGVVFSRKQLLEGIWGYAYDGYEHTVNTHINRLRSKLRVDGEDLRLIETVWGVGYKFREGEG